MSISLSGSLLLTGSIVASGNLTTTGTITAQTLVVQTITSSIVNMTGSNIFGSQLSDRQTFTGSVLMTGSLTVNTSGPELQVTNTGLIFGNMLTDNHSVTGSFRMTGSIASFSNCVGIGMTPTRALDVTGTFRVITPNRSFFVTSNAYSISDGTLSSGIGMDGAGLYLGNVVSSTGWTIGNPQFFISSSGNVGIGTTTPSQLFEVVGGEIKAGRVDSSQEGGQVSFGRSTDNNTAWYIDVYGNVASPQLRFVNVTNSLVAMTITGSNVGIGTSTPSYSLEVAGFTRTQNLRVTTDIYLERTAVSPAIVLDQSDIRIVNQATGVSNTLSTISGYLRSSTGLVANTGTSAMGIGAITSVRRVQWDDSLDEMMVLGSNNGYKPIGASGFNTRSDYRLKEDLQDFNGLEKLNLIKTYNFKWKETGERQDGIIAHELQEILPYAVTGQKDGKNKEGCNISQGVDYSKIVPVLIKSIQEQQCTINTLKTCIGIS